MKLDRLALRLLLAQGADVATFLAFYLLIGAGVHEEKNPLILLLMAMGGLAAVAVFKMGITLIVVARRQRPVVIRHRWFRPLQTVALSAATASGIAGAGFNLAAIVASVG